jgi:RNA polymerase sigma-70 factor (ECF subfamily)
MQTASLAISGVSIPVPQPPGFHDLYLRHSEAVYRTALRVTGNAADAEDVLQTVFLRVLDRQLTLDPLWSPESYLRRAAANASIDLLRRRNTQAETALSEGRDYGGKESTVLLKERLRRSLAKIPAEDAQLFVLCYLEGYTYDELAAMFEVERGTIGSRLHRIRTVLRDDLSH